MLTFFDLRLLRAYFSFDSSPPFPSGRTSGGISPRSSSTSSSAPALPALAAACCFLNCSRSPSSSAAVWYLASISALMALSVISASSSGISGFSS